MGKLSSRAVFEMFKVMVKRVAKYSFNDTLYQWGLCSLKDLFANEQGLVYFFKHHVYKHGGWHAHGTADGWSTSIISALEEFNPELHNQVKGRHSLAGNL